MSDDGKRVLVRRTLIRAFVSSSLFRDNACLETYFPVSRASSEEEWVNAGMEE